MRVLVHLHIYYHEQTEYFVGKLMNISGCEWDLYATMSKLNPVTISMLRAVKPDVRCFEVDNVGYDVWPFIELVKHVRLQDYDLVLKLHTKSRTVIRIHNIPFKGYRWRDALVDAILRDRKRFMSVLGRFSSDPRLGLACSDAFLLEPLPWSRLDRNLVPQELKRLGMKVTDMHFCVGTMFMARACIFRFLQKDNIERSMFPVNPESHSGGTMAHVYERILSMAANACGYRAAGLSTDALVSVFFLIDGLIAMIFRNIFSIRREGSEREKILRVLGLRFRLQ